MTDTTDRISDVTDLDNVWVRIETAALANNARAVRAAISAGQKADTLLMAVVKANAYGHGALIAAKAFREGGANWFGVTSVVEAKELIDGGIDSSMTPILVFTPMVTEQQCQLAIESGLHVTVCDHGHVALIDRIATKLGRQAHVHLKVDTGMSRLGLQPPDSFVVAREIISMAHLNLAGVYTHFATSFEANLGMARKQFSAFLRLCDRLKDADVSGFLRHCANSAAILRMPEAWLDMVRAGTLLYGQYPSSHCPKLPGIEPNTLALKARVVFVHDLPVGAFIGYGAEFQTTRPTCTAVLPIGFADGVTMQPASLSQGLRGLKSLARGFVKSSPTTVKFGDFQAPVLGRVAMQMMVVDVTDAPDRVNIGSVATIPARRLAIRSALPRLTAEDEAAS
jgi:alanine racemase